ncbi:MAG: sensor histidine kinase [Oscillospiraceae bacterium]
MLRKLKIKFILTNMLLVTLVLLCVFSVLLISSARQSKADSIAAMEMTLRRHSDGDTPFEFSMPPDKEDPNQHFIIPTFCVNVDGDGNVLDVFSGNDVKVSNDVLKEAVSQVLSTDMHTGKLPQLGLRYLVRSDNDELHIAFSDLGWEHASLTRLIVTSLLVGLGALVLFFFISLLLSRLSLRPVEQAWAQQRQFVADASHELKTPLTVILANIGIVLGRPNETVSTQEKWLGYIQDEASQMRGLVDDLLFLAKNDAGKRQREMLPVNFCDVVTGCVLRFETVAFERGIALDSKVDPELTVHGDAQALDRLTAILLDNAVKYAGPNGHVCLSLRRESEKSILTVQNTGEPIPPEHLEHIFERFYRADTSRSRESGGYGLGLAIAHAIVQSHNGHITAASGRQGTVFTVTFPIKS